MRFAHGWSPVAGALALILASACGDDSSTDGAGGGGGASSATSTASTSSSSPNGSGTGSPDGAGPTGPDTSTGTSPDAASSSDSSTSSGSTGAGGDGGGSPVTAACAASTLQEPPTDCEADGVLCVGPGLAYAGIQEAADDAQPGDVIVVADGTYAGFQIDHSGTDGAPITFYAPGDVTIDSPAETGDGIRLENASHVRIWGFRVEGVPERCIAARGATPDEPMTDVWVIGNVCRDSGVEGFYLSEISNSHVELNDIDGTGTSGSTRSHGIYLANAGSDGTTICGNAITGAAPEESNGIHFNGDLSVGGDGIISGLLVESNVVWGNAQNGFNLDGVQDSVFRNNVVYGNARHALRAYAIDGAEGPRGLIIASNTLIGSENGWAVRLTEDAGGGHFVFDNVLFGGGEETGAIAIEEGVTFSSANNAVSDRFSPDGEESILTLDAWQSLDYDAGSFVTTPEALFVDPLGDFQLIQSAPAIDAGIPAMAGHDAPPTDIVGTPRPSGAGFDIGAFESP